MRKLAVWTLPLLAAAFAACARQPEPLEVTLKAGEFNFEPSTLEVTAGQPVNMTFMNAGTVEHDFSILEIPLLESSVSSTPAAGHEMGGMSQAPQLHAAAMMGESTLLTFTPTKPGTYPFICTVLGHKEAGMVGTLIVKAP
ncbi:MAG TPA: cupredoxin domain-containing protein [Anaerolineales bacterium]|nr:cupredoxin domain-containing protein [Anaerolineales bacterium]